MSTDNDTVDLPPSASFSGKNTTTLHCKGLGQRMSYAACLGRLAALEADTAPSDWRECGRAKTHGECYASVMREEESDAGKAIFFVPRTAVAETFTPSREWMTPPTKGERKAIKTTVKVARPAPSVLDALDDAGTLADAISDVAKPALLAMLPNETPLQFARRLVAAKNSANADSQD
jgi:hypothetical protein